MRVSISANVDELKRRLDCREVIAADLGQPRGNQSLSSKWWVWPCRLPGHHERNGKSLAATADGWNCYGKCGKGGDAIAWVMEYHGLNFQQAVAHLDGSKLMTAEPREKTVYQDTPAEPPPADWQAQAHEVMTWAETNLRRPEGKNALDYLRGRGLSDFTIVSAHLGHCPGGPDGYCNLHGLKVPTGIVIPWKIGGTIWALNVRRSNQRQRRPKYEQVSGGHTKGALYWAGSVSDYDLDPVIFLEGEFDCLLGWQTFMDIATPVTLGGAGNKLARRWFKRLSGHPHILAAMDADASGAGAADRLGALSGRVRRLEIPNGKDLTEFWLAVGDDGVRAWLQEVVS